MNASPSARWRAAELLTQPHRLCFVAAALVWAGTALAWALALLWPMLPAAPWLPAWPGPAPQGVPLATLHALAFTLGPMPLFFAGFLFASAPKWLRAPPLPTPALLPGVLMLLAGWLLLIALGPRSAPAAALGLASCTLGWAALLARLLQLRQQATRRAGHFDAILAVALLLALALALAALALGLGQLEAARALARAAFWGAVLPVFLIASHRMLPFLTHADAPQAQDEEGARDAPWVVALPLAASAALALQALAGAAASWASAPARLSTEGALSALSATSAANTGSALSAASVASALWPLGALLPAAAGVLTLWLALRWSAHPATRAPLLLRLLRAFAWSGLAWLALAGAALPQLDAAARQALHAAGLHAMALGFAGGTMLCMVTRLSATQAGHSQAVDGVTRVLEALLQLLVGARVLAALWPPAAALALPLAATLWAAIAFVWLGRHGNWAGRARQRPAARSTGRRAPSAGADAGHAE